MDDICSSRFWDTRLENVVNFMSKDRSSESEHTFGTTGVPSLVYLYDEIYEGFQ